MNATARKIHPTLGGADYSVGYQDAFRFVTDPPAKLTAAGLVMLREIYALVPEGERNDDADYYVDIRDLASHHGPNAKRRSAAAVRANLLRGGYLHVEETDREGSDPMAGGYIITGLSLSEKAFAALAAEAE